MLALQPDAAQIADRRLRTRSRADRYRVRYRPARKENERFAARFFLDLLPPDERMTLETRNAGEQALEAGRPRKALAKLATVSEAIPLNSDLFSLVAALQAWFGEDRNLAVTRSRIPGSV